MNEQVRILGIGGTLAEKSTSLVSLKKALSAAEKAGAVVELLDLRELDLPMFVPGKPLEAYGENVKRLVESARSADAMIWSTGAYNGSMAGSFKNAMDFLVFLKQGGQSFLENRVVGLIASSAGDQASINTIRAMTDVAHSLRAVVSPLSVPLHFAAKKVDVETGAMDEASAARLDLLGTVVADLAVRMKGVAYPTMN
ncbi:MAG: NAD(P)H-dependent oxidoreductase [Chloroflexi bacterium]|nr:NAD(P)H-dependent oxidoreductase [Chloroflexota bacterium]